MWFDDDLDGKIKNTNSRRPGAGVDGDGASSPMHDIYNQNNGEDNGNIEMIWEHLTDADGDPNAGDLGKVDMVRRHGQLQDRDNDDAWLEACAAGVRWTSDQ